MKLLLVFLLSACASTSKTRTPSSVSNFDELPACSRVKYVYSTPRVPVANLPPDFHLRARIDAKTMWEATKIMYREGGPGCEASGLRALLERPASCAAWSGPYLEPALSAQYHSMTDEDFALFMTCWQ